MSRASQVVDDFVACVFCGHRTHREAHSCPACQESDFRGRRCFFCERRRPIGEMHKWQWETDNWSSGFKHAACSECVETLFTPPGSQIPCRSCGEVSEFPGFATQSRFWRESPCPSCGDPAFTRVALRVATCVWCGRTIRSFHRHGTHRFKRGKEVLKGPVHDFCRPLAPAAGCSLLVVGLVMVSALFLSWR